MISIELLTWVQWTRWLSGSIALFLTWTPSLRAADAGVTEQSFNVNFREPFFLDHHSGPAMRMVVRNADVAFVDANWTDELGRG